MKTQRHNNTVSVNNRVIPGIVTLMSINLVLISCAVNGTNLALDTPAHISSNVSQATVIFARVYEPSGINCNFGGTRVETGKDNNVDGFLDAGEVTDTEFICAYP